MQYEHPTPPITSDMHLRTLQQFLALAESLHFGRASHTMNISASALSRNIRQLEEQLGTALFERDNRSVSVTDDGKKFEEYARDAVARWNALKDDLTDSSGPLAGELSMYCSVTASHSILYDLLNKFRPLYPRVEIKLQTGSPEEALDRVLQNKEDIAIAAHPKHLPKALAYKAIRVSPLVFITPWAHADPNIPNALSCNNVNWAAVPMILASEGIARDRVDAWFKQRGVSPCVYARVAGNEAIVSMVSLGLGVGVVPQIVLDNSPLSSKVEVLPAAPELEPFDLGLFTLSKRLQNPLIEAIWRIA